MSALADNRDTRELAGIDPVAKFNVINADIVYAGGIVATDYTGELQPASDTAGLRVQGIAPLKVDNTADGETSEVKRGIVRVANSTTSPITRSMIQHICYVEDDQTVAGKTTNFVPAGIILDVDSSGVWVNMRPDALAFAFNNGVKVKVAKTDDYVITAAEAFAGNIFFTGSKSGGMTFTLPSAVGGMKVGIQRLTPDATYDVAIQAATGDKVLGSAASKKVDNAVDGLSGILWLQALDATDWAAAWPPSDLASWVINNA